MRATSVAFLLMGLVLVHNVAGRGYFSRAAVPSKWWYSVWHWGFFPVESARKLANAVLGLSPAEYWLEMGWALGAWWDNWYWRFTRYRVGFRVKVISTGQKFWCRAWMAWPVNGGYWFVGGLFTPENNCWPM